MVNLIFLVKIISEKYYNQDALIKCGNFLIKIKK